MDRTQLCGSCDAGSIPAGTTLEKAQLVWVFSNVVPKTQTALCLCRKRKAFRFPMLIGTKRYTGHVMTDKRTRGPAVFRIPTSP